jgi:hypothetical protein
MARPRKTPLTTNASLLEAALEGLEIQKRRIDEQIQEVHRMLGRRGPRSPKTEAASRPESSASAPKKRELSPAARKRIAAAQKKRWADYRKKTDGAQ